MTAMAMPLQQLTSGQSLFLVEARNNVERNYLLDHLNTALGLGKSLQVVNWIDVPVSNDPSDLRLVRLADRLQDEPGILVVPVRMAWTLPDALNSKSSKKRHLIFGDPRSPGRLRAWTIIKRAPKRVHCLIGQSSTIASLNQRFEQQKVVGDMSRRMEFASFVVRQAGLTLDVCERGLMGQRYKVPRFVAASLSASPKFRKSMNNLAIKLDRPESEVYREAGDYMKELIAKPSALFIDIKAKIDRFMLSQGYDNEVVVDNGELLRLRKTIQEHPTILLFTHKTYIDGVTPTDLAYQNDLPMLHVFGGINLDFFGLGYVLRRAGTIFIRRNFENNPVYKLVLRNYVSYLLEKRFPMTWAFEGTRSRLGKLMPPRYGLLKYVLDSANVNSIKNVHIIPVVTSFDLIRDVEEYALEQTGRVKKPESIIWFLGYLKSLRQPMGKVYVDFGEPVIVENAPQPNDRIGLSKIAFEVAVHANNVTPLTLTSLLCLSLLGTSPRGMTLAELRFVLSFIIKWAHDRNIRFSEDLAQENLSAVQKVIDALVNSRLLVCYDQGSTTVYAIEPNKHPIASYYRNSIIHHFLDKAIIELSIFKAQERNNASASDVFWAETERLRDLFKFEFFYPSKDQYRENLETELSRADPQWQTKLAAGDTGLRSLRHRFQPLVGHAVFLPFVEAYTIVLDVLADLKLGESIDRKSCAQAALKEGRQAYLMRRISSEASIGKILFENGYRMASSQGLTGSGTAEIIAKRRSLLREFRALSRRMEKSRLEVLRLADRVFE
jgi:glycerol-3-phosphate O-acyltransferase